MIFGTKRVSRNSGSRIVGTLFSIKTQIGSKFFLNSPFRLIFESQNFKVYFNVYTKLFITFKGEAKNMNKKNGKKVQYVKG